MIGKHSGACTAVLLALVSVAPLRAETETLEAAWALALSNDPGLTAVAAELDAARARERAARGAHWPTLAVGAAVMQWADAPAFEFATPGMSFRSPPIFADNRFSSRQAELQLPLYAGGSISAGAAAARAAREAAEAEYERAVADLKLEVAERYVAVLRTRAALTAAVAQVQALTAHASDVAVMHERGAVNRSDLLASRVALANAEQQRLRALGAVAQARAAYNRRLGQPLEREPQIADAIGMPIAAPQGSLADLQSQALAQRAELRALSAQAQSLARQARAESGRSLPQIGLTAQLMRLETAVLDRENFSTVGLAVNWRLADGGQTRQRAAALSHASRAVEARRRDMQAAIRLEVEQAVLALDEAQARVAASREAGAQAEENLRMSREQYGAELITNTQVLEAAALRAQAVANARDAELDAELARLRLLHALGAL
ncbi:MAG: TolC family protein [Steroidobacteraceae bacterium]|nr:TolC family protein [Steroidobacteraceae bacterium]MDW8259594.1 TolC family protein [Gammaproteobacteria bacterium]